MPLADGAVEGVADLEGVGDVEVDSEGERESVVLTLLELEKLSESEGVRLRESLRDDDALRDPVGNDAVAERVATVVGDTDVDTLSEGDPVRESVDGSVLEAVHCGVIEKVLVVERLAVLSRDGVDVGVGAGVTDAVSVTSYA